MGDRKCKQTIFISRTTGDALRFIGSIDLGICVLGWVDLKFVYINNF